ncbi:MAG: ferredoxin [Spirochaetes bacterium GWF1_31_7]|nr:MAG: ferredoxin [Spirochaetes bacterium GWE1_32_154]OHD47744.1 MAG: ferredoxin [Spirochaetes bacterium GWF1_31_7]HBD93555.1 ferredoxin [Spirochaetia bacterium]HBI37495.1 ferredoxin [Spirochaetia bacterium]
MNVTISIDGINIEVTDSTTILEAALQVGIKIPTLCFMKDLHKEGICRICLVEVAGRPALMPSCVLYATEGMKIITDSPVIRRVRKTTLELILSNHVKDCLNCERSTNCELQELANRFGVDSWRFDEQIENRTIDDTSYSIVRDSGKCILCRRCISACSEMQSVNSIGIISRGSHSMVTSGLDSLADSVCVNCGQCAAVCPVNAIYEKDEIGFVEKALSDPDKFVVVQTAPAIRAALGETQGLPPGTCVTGKMVSALKIMGFKAIFDTNFTADLTILEEGTELLQRLEKAIQFKDPSVKLPMFTSCSPGWVKFLEHNYPDYTDNLSTAKSPQQMMGTIIKTYYSEKKGIPPEKIVVVSIMPCTAKKFEARRPEMTSSGFQDVDFVLTTRQLGKMLDKRGVDFINLPDSSFDDPLGRSTGAADIFASSGGVMEAALRTVYELVTGRELPAEKLHVNGLMDIHGIREVSLTFENCLERYTWLNGVTAIVGAASGLGNARKVMEKIISGEKSYHFIEFMACPGGCISGGGQPRLTDDIVRMKRFNAIKKEDEGKKLRKSHENPSVMDLYTAYLGSPCSDKAHHLLHTHYTKRGLL